MLAYTSYDIVNTPAGSIASTTVQAALNELDGEKQMNLQFQEEGSNIGTSGGVNTCNFIGSGVIASVSGNTLTVSVSGGGGAVIVKVEVAIVVFP